MTLEGGSCAADNNQVRFVNIASGVGIALRRDRPPTKMAFYAIGKAVSIEPFIGIRFPPA